MWSGRYDSNVRPSAPKADALPDCATPRQQLFYRLWAWFLTRANQCMQTSKFSLPWLEPGQDFPDVSQAWGSDTPAPGLLAAGGALDTTTLKRAYSRGIFPWFSEGEPIMWWSTHPRMVLQVGQFRLHRSLRKTLERFLQTPNAEIRIDTDFDQVIEACAHTPRAGQRGTWIVHDMVRAYQQLHREGTAHSVETWMDGKLVGGLYCVSLGQAVFGESMFSDVSNASKIAMAALVAFCHAHQIAMIDCQQNTSHLASLGAGEITRDDFVQHIRQACDLPGPKWHFDPLYWRNLLPAARHQ